MNQLLSLLYLFIIDSINIGEGYKDSTLFGEMKASYNETPAALKKLLAPDLVPAMKAAQVGHGKLLAYVALGNKIKELAAALNGDRRVTRDQLDVVKAAGLYLRSESEPALAKLKKMASITGNSWIAQQLDSGHVEQDDTLLRDLVKQVTSRDGSKLTIEESKALSTKDPVMYKEYLRLRREYNQVYKDALASYVRQSGHPQVPMTDVDAYMKEHGIESPLPKGFKGLVDDLGRFYTSKGVLIDGVPSAVTFPKIKMNPNYGKDSSEAGNWVFMALREDGSPGPYFYTLEFKKAQKATKHANVADLAPKLESMRKKWFARVKKFDANSSQDVVAVVLEILHEHSARIGSAGNAAGGQSTYGVATLLAKHAYPQSNGNVILRYPGKDGVKTSHIIRATDPEQKYVAAALHTMLDGKKPSDRLFTYDKQVGSGNNARAKPTPITPKQVNDYFKSIGSGTLGVHRIRTAVGSKIFREELDKVLARRDKPKTEKDALDLLKSMAMNVGKKLNHVRRSADGAQTFTPMTAIQNYIDPSLIVEYYEALNMRYPKFVEKLV